MPTASEVANHKPTKEHARPLSPLEKWTGVEATSFHDLHSEIHTFGMEGFAHKPKETRLKGDSPGVRVLVPSASDTQQGPLALIIDKGKAKTFPFINAPGIFPCLIEVRKNVPKALLSFTPVTLEFIKAPIPSVPAPFAQRSLTHEQDPREASVALKKPFDPGGAIKVKPVKTKLSQSPA